MLSAQVVLDLLKNSRKAKEIIRSDYRATKTDMPEIYLNLKTSFTFANTWSFEFFSNIYGNTSVISHELLTNKEYPTTLSAYLDTEYQCSSLNPIMCHWQCNPQNDSVPDNIHLPQQFQNWFYQNPLVKNPFWRWIIFGPKEGGTLLHSDIADTSAWNYLVTGEKLWVFSHLAFHKTKNIFETEAVFVDFVSTAIDIFYIYQRAGDFVWVPSKWVHQVIYNMPSISISENIVNKENINIVKTFYKNTDVQRYKALCLIEKYCQQDNNKETRFA